MRGVFAVAFMLLLISLSSGCTSIEWFPAPPEPKRTEWRLIENCAPDGSQCACRMVEVKSKNKSIDSLPPNDPRTYYFYIDKKARRIAKSWKDFRTVSIGHLRITISGKISRDLDNMQLFFQFSW